MKATTIVIIFIVSLSLGQALQCWVGDRIPYRSEDCNDNGDDMACFKSLNEKGERRGCSNGAWPYKENCHTEKQFKENGDPYTFTECKCKSDLCNGSSTISTGFGFFFFYAIIYYLISIIIISIVSYK